MATDCASFFRQTSIPDKFDEKHCRIQSFAERHKALRNRIVLVSSGGTTVPLESRTVRYVDNFSAGTRGSLSTEYFLNKGYAVIFLYRRKSLMPYTSRFPHTQFLDLLDIQQGQITVKEEHQTKIKRVLQKYKQVMEDELLLMVDFTDLAEYLHLLRACSEQLHQMGKQAMLYLAAAVSDFYIPKHELPEHKIQSNDGPLQLSLQLVPKMLEPLTTEWAPHAFIVSFKLETDKEILLHKAKQALSKYKHQIVVANLLDTRKNEVLMVTKDTDQWIHLSDEEIANEMEIEEKIIEELQKRHNDFITTSKSDN